MTTATERERAQRVFEAAAQAPPPRICANRLFEWITTLAMLGIAVCLMLTPGTIEKGSFRLMLQAGFTPDMLVAFFAVVGSLRVLALIANGRWPVVGPRARAAGALAGACIWLQMAFALVELTAVVGTLSIGIPVYFLLCAGEIVCCYRAAFDVRSAAVR